MTYQEPYPMGGTDSEIHIVKKTTPIPQSDRPDREKIAQ